MYGLVFMDLVFKFILACIVFGGVMAMFNGTFTFGSFVVVCFAVLFIWLIDKGLLG